MLEKAKTILLHPRTLLIIFIIAAIGASVQNYLLGTHLYVAPRPGTYPVDIMNQPHLMNQFEGKWLTEYNNYVIFKGSFFHLLHGTNLYGLYPNEHWDFFKYSPTFSLLMAPMAYMHDVAGLSVWNLLNALTVFFAVRTLPFRDKIQSMLLWLVAMELLTSLQNNQSNGLMCGLIIAAYGSMQKGKPLWATLWLALSVYIKVYGAIGFALFLFYPNDRIKFVLYSAMWMAILFVLPLIVTPMPTLIWQYQNWLELMKADAMAATGLSVAGWLNTWFGLSDVKTYVSLAGIVLFLAQFIRFDLYKTEAYKIMMVASMLIWVVIFNHKAESPTFIIAMAGVGIWYYARPKTTWRTVTIVLAFIFTSLSTTDVFPPFLRNKFVYPYTIKAVPCIIIWFIVFAEIMLMKRDEQIANRVPAIQ